MHTCALGTQVWLLVQRRDGKRRNDDCHRKKDTEKKRKLEEFGKYATMMHNVEIENIRQEIVNFSVRSDEK